MEDQNVELIKEALDSKVVERIYEDGASEVLKEASKIPLDLVKVARLLLAPIQLLGALQDRFDVIVDRIRNKVDVNNLVPIEPEIGGPILENLKYLPEDHILSDFFINLLCSAMDKDKRSKVHPGFIKTLEMLSPDEAVLLYILSKKELQIVDTMVLNKQENRFHDRKEEKSEIPNDDLIYPKNFNVYYTHLEALGLVTWPVYKQDPIKSNGQQTGIRRYSKLMLTDFGKYLIEICVPDEEYLKNKMSEYRKKRGL